MYLRLKLNAFWRPRDVPVLHADFTVHWRFGLVRARKDAQRNSLADGSCGLEMDGIVLCSSYSCTMYLVS